jgi:hypothetical protein
MTNKLFKFELDAPGTADDVESLELTLDRSKGPAFRIEKAWISFQNRDAVAAGDTVGLQISTKSRDDLTTLYDIASEYEVFTWAEISSLLGTNGPEMREHDISVAYPIPGIEGTILRAGTKYYLNLICTGQDGADVTAKVKILGQYVKKISADDLNDWHYNQLS